MSVLEAEIHTIYYDKRTADEDDYCEVRITEREIVLSYEYDDGVVIFKGKNNGDGHFLLKCPERNGQATLHQFPGSKILEGYWQEDGYRGFWRIILP